MGVPPKFEFDIYMIYDIMFDLEIYLESYDIKYDLEIYMICDVKFDLEIYMIYDIKFGLAIWDITNHVL